MMECLKGLKTYGTKVYRTDEDGEIVITINKKGRIKVRKTIF